MKVIKYHQYGLGNEYGTDGKLTNNWNPDFDYGNEFVNVHINIDTPSYDYQSSFASVEDREAWRNEVSNLISSFGILEDCGYKVENGKNKCAYLYAHPQQISGVIRKNDVKKVSEAISNMKLSSIHWVDLHETVYVISDTEYAKYLNGKKNEIRKLLFEKAATKRKTNFYLSFDVARNIAGIVKLHRLGLNDGKNYCGGQTVDYILNIAEQMINEGYLISIEQDGQKYIRSLNKTEQKNKKFIA